jgi:hypothetical protein
VLAVLALSGGSAPEKEAKETSGSEAGTPPGSPLISGPPAHAVRSAPLPSRRKPRVHRADRDRPPTAEPEQAREPLTPPAPTSSVTPLPEASAPSEPVVSETPPPPPSPPASGEGSGAEGEFGFER